MDEKQYAIKCGVCGTEFYILAPACPNCRAKGQSRLLNYLLQNEFIEFIIHILLIIYNVPLLVAYLFINIVYVIISLIALFLIIGALKEIIEDFSIKILIEIFNEIIEFIIHNNFIKENILIVAVCVVVYFLIEKIIFPFLKKIIDKEHLSFCIGYKRKKNRKIFLYMASEEIIKYFSHLPEELEREIYNSYGYKIKNKLFLLKNCIDNLEKAKNECRAGRYKDIQITYEWIREIKEIGGINVRGIAKYFLERERNHKYEYSANIKENINNPDKIYLFLIDCPEENDVEVAIVADSENLFIFYKILNLIALLLLPLSVKYFIQLWIEKM